MKKFVLVFLLLFTNVPASEALIIDNKDVSFVEIDNVVRIFMHEPDDFSVMTKDATTGIMIIRRVGEIIDEPPYNRTGRDTYEFVTDVPADKEMYVVVTIWFRWKTSRFSNERYRDGRDHFEATFHVHSEKDVEGGGWNHGKYGRGQTAVVE